MTVPAMPLIISAKAQEGIIEFQRQCYNMLNQQWNLRDQMQITDRLYAREQNRLEENRRAKLANKYGDQNRYQDITIPIVMEQVENAVSYQTSVFLTGTPLFGVVASPKFEDQARAMETVIDNNAIRGSWNRELMMVFRDGFKYNLAATEVSWDRETVAALETDSTYGNGKQGKPKEIIWEGNKVKRLDLYNTFFDSRVAPTKIHEQGEFAGYTELKSRIELKSFIAKLPDKMTANVIKAFESGLGNAGLSNGSNGGIESYYTPDINQNALLQRNQRDGLNWLAWAGMAGSDNKIQYKAMYEVTTLYGRIIPSDFGLRVPCANTPQVWKFIIVNHEVIIYAERCTNAHGWIPILFSQPYEDGLTYQTKSLVSNVQPMQDVGSALMNSIIAARRRAISDRGLYDPSRVSEAHINSTNPSAKIPVRPAAYGKPLNEAYYPIPFRDDQSAEMMNQIGMISALANRISGQNPAKQGQFVKGNKTLHEYDDVMSHANGRDQMTSMLYEAQMFTPMKQIIKSDILQYQQSGSVFARDKKAEVKIDPVALRQATMEFKVSDGLTPADKLINSDVLMVSMQQIGSSPQIAAGYNIAPMFSYLMKTQGADLAPFEKSAEQMAYEQAMGQWQQLVLQMQKQNPDIDPKQYPAQPVPQQFGYQPSGNEVAK